MSTQNYHAIQVRFIGPTNYRGARVKLTSGRFSADKANSVTIPFDYSASNTLDIAENWLTANGFELMGSAENRDSYVIFASTFKRLEVQQ